MSLFRRTLFVAGLVLSLTAALPAGAATIDGCSGSCGSWVLQANNPCISPNRLWKRTCTQGGITVTQETCAQNSPGNCANSQSFLPNANNVCKGSCDPWYWQPDPGSCAAPASRWKRLCHAAGKDVWQEACSSLRPSGCAERVTCFCPGGTYYNGVAVDPAGTYCGFRHCGQDNGYYDCNPDGWAFLGGSCPVMGDAASNACTYARTGARPFPTGPMAVKAINYFPGEHTFERMWQNWDYEAIVADFNILQQMNVNAVRILLQPGTLGHSFPAESKAKVDRILCEASQRGIKVIFDLLPPGYPCAALTASQSDFIRKVVTAYRDDQNILMWELSNEPTCGGWDQLPSSAQNNLIAGINLIKGIDSVHAVSVPLLQYTIDKVTPALLAKMDVFNFHVYDVADPNPTFNLAVSKAGGKPLFLGEFGCFALNHDPALGLGPERYCASIGTTPEDAQRAHYKRFLDAALARGFAGVAPWAFSEFEERDPYYGDSVQNTPTYPDMFLGIVKLDHRLTPAAVKLQNFYGNH